MGFKKKKELSELCGGYRSKDGSYDCPVAGSGRKPRLGEDIFNADQGSQFNGTNLIGVLKRENIQSNMDGKGRWMDNVFIERLWRTVKYWEVYLRAYEDFLAARASLGRYFEFHNSERRH